MEIISQKKTGTSPKCSESATMIVLHGETGEWSIAVVNIKYYKKTKHNLI